MIISKQEIDRLNGQKNKVDYDTYNNEDLHGNTHYFIELETGKVFRYSGFWKRVVATFIDSIIYYISLILFFYLLALFASLLTNIGVNESTSQTIVGKISILLLLSMHWLYHSFFESSKLGASLGKLALGMKVVDCTGRRISFMKATARYWSKLISALPMYIGFIMAGFTKDKQALHDLIAATYVINKKELKHTRS